MPDVFSPYKFIETARSREGSLDASGERLALEFFVDGVEDHNHVLGVTLANTEPTFRGLTRKSIRRRNLGSPAIWLVTVDYGLGIEQGFTPATRSFRISAARVKVTQSLGTRYRRTSADNNLDDAAVGSGEDNQGAIGVTDDGVQGCEKVVGQMSWSKTVQRATCTDAYIRTLNNLVGRVNREMFYGYPPYSVMYMGCDPSEAKGELNKSLSIWSLTHLFDDSPNRVNQTVGGIVIPEKRGHEYLWFKYGPSTNANKRVQVPTVAYVEEIAEVGNFELIGIGMKEGDPIDSGSDELAAGDEGGFTFAGDP